MKPENYVGEATLTVKPSAPVKPVKPMNAANDGPVKTDRCNCWREFKALKVPYARTHDMETIYAFGGNHVCAISELFPDFDADETDPENYEFATTDAILAQWREAGTQIFFRLGEHSQDFAKQFVQRPKDNAKWARICERVIRHYNEGWANGFKWGIEYWEIWNEPDIETDEEPVHHMWLGTRQQFFDLFKTTVKHLNARFPELKIGGPALCWDRSFMADLLKQCKAEGIRPAFMSWHSYPNDPELLRERARAFRKIADDAGFPGIESIDDEWNYNEGWGKAFLPSIERIPSYAAASFCMSMMLVGQQEPVDMMMYYDLRPASVFNGVFNVLTRKVEKPYWAFLAFRRLVEAGTEVKSVLDGEKDGVTALAAKGKDGRLVVVVSRYTRDLNEFRARKVTVRIAGRKIPEETSVKLVDRDFSYGEVFFPVKDGALELELAPNAFAVLEL